MEIKDNYLSEEDIKRLKAVENFRSLAPLSPEELEKLSMVEEKYQEALQQLKATDVVTVAKGITTIIEQKLDPEIASSVITGLNRIVKIANSQIVKTKEEQEQKATVSDERNAENAVKETANAESAAYVSKRDGTVYKKGDILEFGRYPQSSVIKTQGWIKKTETKEFPDQPIEWRVLKTEDNRMLVISEMGIDCKKYHGKREDVTWEDCDLRKWLNSEFKANAFSNEEIRKVQLPTNENKDNSEYGTKGGKATENQVFLLSLEEAEKYFKDDDSRRCKATEYAVKHGTYVNKGNNSKANGFSWWWLRSPGFYGSGAANVNPDGSLSAYGIDVDLDIEVVRPALWLEI